MPPDPDPAPSVERATLTGTVTYRERIALRPGAVIHVRLDDISLADAPARTLARHTIRPGGQQVPIPFSLDYDASAIQPRRTYAVRAEIRDADGALMWTTDTVHPVLTNGAPSEDVEVMLVRVASQDQMSEPRLVGPIWRLAEIVSREGTGRTPIPAGEYSLAFADDGRVSGQAHCNRLSGQYETDGDWLSLDGSATTLAACLPPSSASAVMGTLNVVERFRFDGARLRLETGDGRALVFRRESDLGMNPQPTTQSFDVTCAEAPGGAFRFRAKTGPGEVAVWLPERFGGRYLVLSQVRAASGAKYQEGDVTVWTKGDEALVEIGGETFTGCAFARTQD